jgi:tRNA dimethylallyltransferase
MSTKHLIILSGPTASGKTTLAISLARHLHTGIINADSRQVYKEMTIGTAAPSREEQNMAKHFFVGHRSIHQPYNASQFEQDVIALLNHWYADHDLMIMAGGSGMYIDAVCRGIDDLPTVDAAVREHIHEEYRLTGIEGIRSRLEKADPVYFQKVDRNNPQRIMKALEISEMTGRPYSSFLTGSYKERKFKTLRISLDMPRKELHDRINKRTEDMMSNGLLQEAQLLFPFRSLNALNTVGYKELFSYFEGKTTLNQAVEKIKDHTRQYARRQLTWFRRDKDTNWFHPSDFTEILNCIGNHL